MRPDSDKLVLMDNNILACDYGIKQLGSLIDSGYKIDLNQGMDARLVTDEIAQILSRLKWIRYLRFSCDSTPQIAAIHNPYRASNVFNTHDPVHFFHLPLQKLCHIWQRLVYKNTDRVFRSRQISIRF